ncbi:hypothetical protein PR002_g32326, partial [Phytophthora rubi]
PQGNQAQRRSGQGGASTTARALRQPGPASGGASHRSRYAAKRQPGPASGGASHRSRALRWCFPQIKGLKATGPRVGWCFPQIKVRVRAAGGGGAVP